MAGEFDSGARMDTVEDDHTSDLGSEDPMESMKRDLWSDVKDDYDI